MSNTIDALALKKAFIAGANNLDKNKEYINELNVFPVPDGDTGTNMTLTILSAVRCNFVTAFERLQQESAGRKDHRCSRYSRRFSKGCGDCI